MSNAIGVSRILVGNPREFAIETGVTRTDVSKGQLALGYFILHITGRIYGVCNPEATMLGWSFDEVKLRLADRGTHVFQYAQADAVDMAVALCDAGYHDPEPGKRYFGMTDEAFTAALIAAKVWWAPDGDEAFDDGSNVLQFDVGDKVRLIACVTRADLGEIRDTVSECWLDSDEFYGLLSTWIDEFERLVQLVRSR